VNKNLIFKGVIMQVIQEEHHKTKEELQQLLLELLEKNGISSAIQWRNFTFEGKSHGTSIKGEILDNEIYVEISGWFERIAAQRIRHDWEELVKTGLV
jgi:hypothetical protein